MAASRRFHALEIAIGLAAAIVWLVGVGWVVASAARNPATDLHHPAILASAAQTVAWMVLAWSLLLAFRAGSLARLAWTFGLLTLFVHLTLAFGLAHGWSHAAAVEYIRQVGGFGGGIVVNYLFAGVWLADVVWWWAKPASHANRPRWVGWAIHGFLAFIVVNATVVFGPPERRVWYAATLGLLALLWFCARLAQKHEPGLRPGSDRAPESSAGHSPT